MDTVVKSSQQDDDRTGLSIETLRRAFADNLYYEQGKFPAIATLNDFYMALALTVRDRLLNKWINTVQTYLHKDVRVVCYLSAEFLMGPHLGNAMINLGIYDQVEKAVEESGLNLQELIDQEEEPGLGNGGLGRLAACYLDSLATLEIPAIGYGIRYEFGIFDQEIRDGWQVETTDKWLRYGNPWELPRPESSVEVKFGGHTVSSLDEKGYHRIKWIPDRVVIGVPYDTPVPGYGTNTANILRLWKAEALESFDFSAFNTGDYVGAVNAKITSENISKVLYPNDNVSQGKQLRLEQQYFFVSCALQNIIDFHTRSGRSIHTLHEKFTLQLNDTHPSIAIPELMRLLIDVHELDWDTAWLVTTEAVNYTNHTLLPEALERWPVALIGSILPRHLEIIYEINRRFLAQVRADHPGNKELLSRVSLIDESGERCVRMAHLASVGSKNINGVAALHSELLKSDVLSDFHEISPQKFKNVTNGVTPRRWMLLSNPDLSRLITENIGAGWVTHLENLKLLEPLANDESFKQAWQAVKRGNKLKLSKYIHDQLGLAVDPNSLFDIQVKRFHEYKRQHLNVLHIITMYNFIKENPNVDVTPRTFLFGGKAAPGYFIAKLIIKLINSVAEVIGSDRAVRDKIKVIFLPNYSVTLGQRVYPAADLSEQISTAGKEASGTGNMKFSLNGALTIGTMDGANVEIRQEVGAENFFLFGLTEEEVKARRAAGYRPHEEYLGNERLKRIIDQLSSGYFSRGDENLFRPLIDSLLGWDDYMLLADYQSYIECQEKVGHAYKQTDEWTRMSILNVARMGKFSSDRSVREYCENIWETHPSRVELTEQHSRTLLNVCEIPLIKGNL